MPSALTMQIAFLEGAAFADNRAESEPYVVLVDRWRDRSIAYTVQAACLDELINVSVATSS